MKNTQLYWNAAAGTLAALVLAVIIWGCAHGAGPLRVEVSDGIEPVDLDTVYLSRSEEHTSELQSP